MKLAALVVLGMGLAIGVAFAQVTLSTDAPLSPPIQMTVPLDGPVSALTVKGGTCAPNCFVVYANYPDGSAAHVPFKLSRIEPASRGLLFVSPSSGITPLTVSVGINESVLYRSDPGAGFFLVYFSTVDQSPSSETAAPVNLAPTITAPVIGSILNAATFQATIAPGTVVSIFGKNLAPPREATSYDAGGLYPTTLGFGTLPPGAGNMGNTTVTFNGIAAPLLYVSPNQVNVLVPYGLAGQKTANVVVTRYTLTSNSLVVPLTETAPGIFTATQNGSGQGAILNTTDRTGPSYNNVSNPAPKGSLVIIYATGSGVWDPAVPDGAVALVSTNPGCFVNGATECRRIAAQPISLTIGGKPALVYYAASAPYLPWGMLQINAYVPTDVDSGEQPVVLTIGQNGNSQQKVTVSVQ